MSINALNSPFNGAANALNAIKAPTTRPAGAGTAGGMAPGANGADGTLARTTGAANDARALRVQTPIAGHGATQSTVPAEAPAGTDPALWSVLTTDERNFFAKSASMGPLTYGRIKAAANPAPPAARGVRLDVRA